MLQWQKASNQGSKVVPGLSEGPHESLKEKVFQRQQSVDVKQMKEVSWCAEFGVKSCFLLDSTRSLSQLSLCSFLGISLLYLFASFFFSIPPLSLFPFLFVLHHPPPIPSSLHHSLPSHFSLTFSLLFLFTLPPPSPSSLFLLPLPPPQGSQLGPGEPGGCKQSEVQVAS